MLIKYRLPNKDIIQCKSSAPGVLWLSVVMSPLIQKCEKWKFIFWIDKVLTNIFWDIWSYLYSTNNNLYYYQRSCLFYPYPGCHNNLMNKYGGEKGGTGSIEKFANSIIDFERNEFKAQLIECIGDITLITKNLDEGHQASWHQTDFFLPRNLLSRLDRDFQWRIQKFS